MDSNIKVQYKGEVYDGEIVKVTRHTVKVYVPALVPVLHRSIRVAKKNVFLTEEQIDQYVMEHMQVRRSLSDVHEWIVAMQKLGDTDEGNPVRIVVTPDDGDDPEAVMQIQKLLAKLMDHLYDFDAEFHERFDCR